MKKLKQPMNIKWIHKCDGLFCQENETHKVHIGLICFSFGEKLSVKGRFQPHIF